MPHVPEEIALVADEILAAREIQHQLLVVQVDQVFQIVLCTPVRLDAKEAAAEDAAPDVPIVGFGAPRLVSQFRREEQRQIRLQIVSLLLFELLQQGGGPGDEACVIGLVAEKAQYRFAELVAEQLFVNFMGGL